MVSTPVDELAENSANLRGARRRDVYLTGFGKFGDILENPTTFLVQELASDANVTESLVLEVSAEGSLDMLAPMRARAEERDHPCVFLHLGVSAKSTQFALERVGYNIANFSIPDERGWVAKDAVIAADEPDSIETSLPLEDLLVELKKDTELVDISVDPGRYICNFVYFDSLRWVKKQLATTRSSHENQHFALFLHVPQFTVISMEDQLRVVRQVIDFLASL